MRRFPLASMCLMLTLIAQNAYMLQSDEMTSSSPAHAWHVPFGYGHPEHWSAAALSWSPF